jgi:hypothetical protein
LGFVDFVRRIGSTQVVTGTREAEPVISDPASICGASGCSPFGLLRDYQTLVAGLIALVAAFIAVAPVKKQLSEMATQTRIVLIDHLGDRVVSLNREIDWWQRACGQVLQDIASDVYDESDVGGAPSYDSNWAFDCERRFDGVIAEAEKHVAALRGTPPPEADRLLVALNGIVDCLDAIHRPISADQTDFEPIPSDEDWAAVKARLEAEAAQAAADLVRRAAAAQRALGVLQESFEVDRKLAQLRLAALHRADAAG